MVGEFDNELLISKFYMKQIIDDMDFWDMKYV